MAGDAARHGKTGAVLVDTSVWIDHLRGRTGSHVAALRALLLQPRAVAIAPPILQEILQGANTHASFARLSRIFMAIQCLAPLDGIAAAAESARLFLECRLHGKTPRSSHDCLIACIAIEHDVALLHNDRDFEVIAGVEPRLRLHRYRRVHE